VKVKRFWTIWKHALGSFSDEQTAGNDDIVCGVRTVIVGVNLTCAIFIMANIVNNWG
tara:strand:+ start:3174 stop:3344 length:171 start_codon:yes stop_codon:yes gene_type:complete